METLNASRLRERLDEVHERIRRAGSDPSVIELVAVMKEHPEAYDAAIECGLREFAENRRHLGGWPDGDRQGCRLHFIGHIQRRDVKKMASQIDLWQSVDRPEAAEEIAKASPGASVLLQVNISGESQKHGCRIDEVPARVEQFRSLGVDVQGLMGMGPLGEPEEARPGFRRLRALAEAEGLATVSMGMSADYEVAVQEGSTMLRLGQVLFGPRTTGRVH